MDQRTLIDSIDNANIRTEVIFHLHTACAAGSVPDELSDAIRDSVEAADAIGFELEDWDIPDWELEERIVEHVFWPPGRGGWLVHFGCPVRTFREGSTSSSYSWGHIYTKWIFASTFEEACELAIQWASDRYESDKAKAA